MCRILLVVALVLFPGIAICAMFTAPLPDLVGVIDFTPQTGGKRASFSVGQRFSQIDNVWIEIEAQVFAAQFDDCGTVFIPRPCEPVIQLLGFVSIMDEDSPIPGFVWSDGVSFSDDFGALEASGVGDAIFNNPLVGWDFLLEGDGSLTLFWNTSAGNPDTIALNVVHPTGEIFDARLLIEGTAVPEPSTPLAAIAMLAVLAWVKRRVRSPRVYFARNHLHCSKYLSTTRSQRCRGIVNVGDFLVALGNCGDNRRISDGRCDSCCSYES